jgi:2-polyprenyl-6-hydroxyphenyl methylase/3-demethylubiquinone-9 3-methyltransferase
VPVDNQLYDRMAGSWWEESGLLHMLAALNPPRLRFMRRMMAGELGIDPRGRRALDVGCGGGLLCEELARLGCTVAGVDPSAESLAAARAHAGEAGLSIDYREGTGEALPFPDASFDIVTCCDVLEHVADLPRVIGESARVLAPGGVFFYDTINRTQRSRLVIIKLFQEWGWTSFMPPDLHDWTMFIRPAELLAILARQGLESRGLTGLEPAGGPLGILRAFRVLRARKRGAISYAEAVRRIDLCESRGLGILYLGCAVKGSRAART